MLSVLLTKCDCELEAMEEWFVKFPVWSTKPIFVLLGSLCVK